jgi:hypothetical protein
LISKSAILAAYLIKLVFLPRAHFHVKKSSSSLQLRRTVAGLPSDS